MAGLMLSWAVSAVASAVFLGYWIWRIERGHRRRMQSIAEQEARDRAWMEEAARVRSEHMAWVARTESWGEEAVADTVGR